MLNSLKEKLSKLKKIDNSLVNRLDKIKQADQKNIASQNNTAPQNITISQNNTTSENDTIPQNTTTSENDTDPQNNADSQNMSVGVSAVPEFDANMMAEIQKEMIEKIEDIVNSKSESINTNTESMKELDSRFNKMEISVSTVKKNIDEYSERFDKMEETILELLSLYEVVSNSVNPFVGDSDNKSVNFEKIEEFEKRFKGIGDNFEQMMNKIESINSSNTDENMDELRNEFIQKFKTFEERLDEMHSSNGPAIEVQTEQKVLDDPDYPLSVPVQDTIESYSKPRSNNLPMLVNIDNNPETSVVLLNLVEFLMEKVGRNNLMDVLDYYIEIGWIGENVSNVILSYASGIDYYDEKPTWKLMPQDHTKSLMFIERLTGKKIDRSTFYRIERDIEKVKHHSEPYFEM